MVQKRIPVEIKWDEDTQSFHAFREGTGEKVKNYSQLTYGRRNPNAPDNMSDEAVESEKTFKHTGAPLPANRDAGNLPDKTASIKGWVTVDE